MMITSHKNIGRTSRWRLASMILASAAVLVAGLWGVGALAYQWPGNVPRRMVVVVAWCVLSAATVYRLWAARHGNDGASGWRRWPSIFIVAFAVAFAAMLGWWFTIEPSSHRDWADDVARPLVATVDGNRVVLADVRDFDWRSDTDYTQRWETRTYALDHLASADLILSYWMGPAIAHTLVSFDFGDGGRVVFSLEIRRERTEAFSAIGGFFKEFEEVIVASDERDIVRVRTNVRGEDDYLYHLSIPPAALQQAFLAYVARAQALQRRPAFYNTLTSNCTTILFDLARKIEPSLPFDIRLLLSGYFAAYAYDHGGLMPGYAFDTLKAAGHFTSRALAAGNQPSASFSAAIRTGVPVAPAASAAR